MTDMYSEKNRITPAMRVSALFFAFLFFITIFHPYAHADVTGMDTDFDQQFGVDGDIKINTGDDEGGEWGFSEDGRRPETPDEEVPREREHYREKEYYREREDQDDGDGRKEGRRERHEGEEESGVKVSTGDDEGDILIGVGQERAQPETPEERPRKEKRAERERQEERAEQDEEDDRRERRRERHSGEERGDDEREEKPRKEKRAERQKAEDEAEVEERRRRREGPRERREARRQERESESPERRREAGRERRRNERQAEHDEWRRRREGPRERRRTERQTEHNEWRRRREGPREARRTENRAEHEEWRRRREGPRERRRAERRTEHDEWRRRREAPREARRGERTSESNEWRQRREGPKEARRTERRSESNEWQRRREAPKEARRTERTKEHNEWQRRREAPKEARRTERTSEHNEWQRRREAPKEARRTEQRKEHKDWQDRRERRSEAPKQREQQSEVARKERQDARDQAREDRRDAKEQKDYDREQKANQRKEVRKERSTLTPDERRERARDAAAGGGSSGSGRGGGGSVSWTDDNGNTRTIETDSDGTRVETTTSEDGKTSSSIETRADGTEIRTETTEDFGTTTTTTRTDENGNTVVTTEFEDGAVRTETTNADGETTRVVTTDDGHSYTTVEDGDGNVTGVDNQYNDGSSYSHDVETGVTTETNVTPTGHTSTTVTQPNGDRTTVSTDDNGNTVTVHTDQYGYQSTTVTDGDGNVVMQSDPVATTPKEPGQEYYERNIAQDGASWDDLPQSHKDRYADRQRDIDFRERQEQARIERERVEAERERQWEIERQERQAEYDRRHAELERERQEAYDRYQEALERQELMRSRNQADADLRNADLALDNYKEEKGVRYDHELRNDPEFQRLLEERERIADHHHQVHDFTPEEQAHVDAKQAARDRFSGLRAQARRETDQAYAEDAFDRELENQATNVGSFVSIGAQMQHMNQQDKNRAELESARAERTIELIDEQLRDTNLSRAEREVLNEMRDLALQQYDGAEEFVSDMDRIENIGYVADVAVLATGGLAGAGAKTLGRTATTAVGRTLAADLGAATAAGLGRMVPTAVQNVATNVATKVGSTTLGKAAGTLASQPLAQSIAVDAAVGGTVDAGIQYATTGKVDWQQTARNAIGGAGVGGLMSTTMRAGAATGRATGILPTHAPTGTSGASATGASDGFVGSNLMDGSSGGSSASRGAATSSAGRGSAATTTAAAPSSVGGGVSTSTGPSGSRGSGVTTSSGSSRGATTGSAGRGGSSSGSGATSASTGGRSTGGSFDPAAFPTSGGGRGTIQPTITPGRGASTGGATTGGRGTIQPTITPGRGTSTGGATTGGRGTIQPTITPGRVTSAGGATAGGRGTIQPTITPGRGASTGGRSTTAGGRPAGHSTQVLDVPVVPGGRATTAAGGRTATTGGRPAGHSTQVLDVPVVQGGRATGATGGRTATTGGRPAGHSTQVLDVPPVQGGTRSGAGTTGRTGTTGGRPAGSKTQVLDAPDLPGTGSKAPGRRPAAQDGQTPQGQRATQDGQTPQGQRAQDGQTQQGQRATQDGGTPGATRTPQDGAPAGTRAPDAPDGTLPKHPLDEVPQKYRAAGDEAKARQDAWENAPREKREQYARDVVDFIDQAAQNGDRWAQRYMADLKAGKLDLSFEPGLSPNIHGLNSSGRMRLNPLDANGRVRPPAELGSVALHEGVHAGIGGKKPMNEARAHFVQYKALHNHMKRNPGARIENPHMRRQYENFKNALETADGHGGFAARKALEDDMIGGFYGSNYDSALDLFAKTSSWKGGNAAKNRADFIDAFDRLPQSEQNAFKNRVEDLRNQGRHTEAVREFENMLNTDQRAQRTERLLDQLNRDLDKEFGLVTPRPTRTGQGAADGLQSSSTPRAADAPTAGGQRGTATRSAADDHSPSATPASSKQQGGGNSKAPQFDPTRLKSAAGNVPKKGKGVKTQHLDPQRKKRTVLDADRSVERKSTKMNDRAQTLQDGVKQGWSMQQLENAAVSKVKSSQRSSVIGEVRKVIPGGAARKTVLQQPGFDTVAKDLGAGGTKRQGARHILRLANDRVTQNPKAKIHFEDFVPSKPNVYQDVKGRGRVNRQGSDMIVDGDIVQAKSYQSFSNAVSDIKKQIESDLVRYGDRGWTDGLGRDLSGRFEYHIDKDQLSTPATAKQLQQAQQTSTDLTNQVNQAFTGPNGKRIEIVITVD